MTGREDYVRGQVPTGPGGGVRCPTVSVRLCAGCAGFAPFTSPDYDGQLSGWCAGCGSWSRELHRFAAFIYSALGCSCSTHGAAVCGDLFAGPGDPPAPPAAWKS